MTVSFHGPFDDEEYGCQLYGGERVDVDGMYVLVKDDRSGPAASFGGWAFERELVESPRVSELHPVLDSLPPMTLRLAAPTYYPAPFWHGLCSAAAFGGWRFRSEVVMVCDHRWKLRRSKREDVRYGIRDGAEVVDISPGAAMEFLGREKTAKGYPWTYDDRKYAEQVRRWTNFRQQGVLVRGELVAALCTVWLGDGPETMVMTAGQQSAAGRQVHAFEVLMVTATEQAFALGATYVDLGPIGQQYANLVTYKEGFGARPYVRWSISND